MFNYTCDVDFKRSYNATIHAVGFSCACNVDLNHSHNSTVHAHWNQEKIWIPTSTCLVFTKPVWPLMQMSPLYKIGNLQMTSWQVRQCMCLTFGKSLLHLLHLRSIQKIKNIETNVNWNKLQMSMELHILNQSNF